MQPLAADLHYALRMMRKNPGFSLVAIAALALGIGANTAIFTVVNAVLLQPLPYPQPERIVKLGRQFQNGIGWSISIPKYMVWRRNDVFEAITLYGQGGPGITLGRSDPPQQVKSLQVSKDYFRVFGVAPVIGRTFAETEDLPGGPPVAVIGYDLWQTRLGGDSQIVGRTILLNAKPYTVIGILPASFHADPPVDVWLPMEADPASTNQGHYLQVAARLKPEVTIQKAQAEMKVVGEQFRRAYPTWMDAHESVAVKSMRDALVDNVRTALYILFGAVALVLLIACANVANLLLARAAGRQREMAIRAAVGANRRHILRQLLTESILLAGLGGVLGFVLGSWGVRALLLAVPANIPRLAADDGVGNVIPALDWRVGLFTLGLGLLTGVLFGLFPALHLSKPDLSSTLKEGGGRSGTGLRHGQARAALVVAEIALALVLLTGAALLIRSFVGLRTVNPGIDAHNVLTMETSMSGGQYSTTAKVDSFVTQVVRRVEALPGVEGAACSIVLPLTSGIDLPFTIAGKPPANSDRYNGDEQWRSVSPHYFRVFKIPLLRGRLFSETDLGNASRVVIINEAMARKYWKDQDPVGQVITIGKGLGPEFEDPPRQIVGIVGNVKETGLNAKDQGVMYIPQSQMPQGLTALANSVLPLSWSVRATQNPTGLRMAIEQEFRAVDGQMTVARVKPMEQVIADSIARQNFTMLLLSIFAGIALLLAAIGIYGLMSYSVEQRTQEIGIRVALGAGRPAMLRLVLGQGLKLAGAGVVAGMAIAFGMTRVLATLLFGIKATDPMTYAGVAAILMAVALSATYLPARRAATVEPIEALRYQ
jgi:putative ABC transport system permease protein